MADFWGGGGSSRVLTEPPFGLHLVLRSTDDNLNSTSSLATKLRKLQLWLTLAEIRLKMDGRIGLVCLKNDRDRFGFLRSGLIHF